MTLLLTMYLQYMTIFICVYISIVRGTHLQPESDEISKKPTIGHPWPKPQSIQTTAARLAIHPSKFEFMINETSHQCDILRNAFDRYYKMIFFPQAYMLYLFDPLLAHIQINSLKSTIKNVSEFGDVPLLRTLVVRIEQPCEEWPRLESNESCV